jgi:hypothetical protein
MNRTLTIPPAFTPLTVLLMVLGFMLFWPLGLAMLAYMLFGDRLPEFRAGSVRFGYAGPAAARPPRSYGFANCFGTSARAGSGNAAFDEYRRRELDRLEAERRRLEEERAEFEAYLHNLRRARDQEEFDRYMAERRRNQGGSDMP